MRRYIYLISIALLASAASVGTGQTLEEYQVKAAYVLNVAKFTDWPGEANIPKSEPFTICIIGLDPFGHWLDDSVGVEAPKGRPLRVRRIGSASESAGCQIVFVSSSERKKFPAILAELAGRSVLTIGDCDAAWTDGVAVNFTRDGTRVHFQVNTESAQAHGLRISPRLLSLATTVKNTI